MRRGYKSNIDLVLSSPPISDSVSTTICDETWGSDHFPIFINVHAEKFCYHIKTFKIDSIRTDWQEADHLFEEAFSRFLTPEYERMPVRSKFDIYFQVIKDTISVCTPNKRPVSRRAHINPVPWWDAECDRAKRLRRAAYKKFSFSRKLDDLIVYNRRCAEAKKLFKTKKKNCFRSFAESLNFHVNPSYVWNTCKIFKKAITNVKPLHTSSYLQPGEGTSGALNKICPPWAPTRPDEEPSCESNDFLDMQIDFEEFNVALEDKKDSASPGMDGLNFGILKRLPIKYELQLLDLFNEMIKLGEFPHSWRDVFVHFIKKPDGKNYRPISLTSCTCKLLETIIKNRLQWWAETNNWLPLCQHGFRKGNSGIDNLAGLTMTVQSAFKERRDVYATFLDIEGAFDNVNIDILIQKLADLGSSLSTIRFIKFITAERHIFTSKHKSSHLVSYKGLPQGAVLSPLLYAIYTASLTSNLPESVSASCFADDTALYIKSDPHSSSIQTLEKAFKILDQNITNLGLSIAPHKSSFLHFSRTTKSSKQQIKIKSHMLSAQSSVKFLGITFDPRLDFNLQQPDQYLKFVWIPSHIGIPGNEAVKRPGQSAITSADRLSTQVPFTDFFQGFSEGHTRKLRANQRARRTREGY
ncbi:unnamed protein product [Trichogramma brassicae]|uniref:Reverse transcriptase domain-containing protein n=1 Tax=Trichogramma brassicae TaxID=86971 RepID=A0A6H5J3H8_9HYME|nr:unnamed protein product [Trichogramma brassicae]